MDTNMRGLTSQPTNGATTADISSQIETLKSEFTDLAGKVALATKAQAADLQHAAEDKTQELRHAIRSNPMQATLITAGIGFVFGLLMTR